MKMRPFFLLYFMVNIAESPTNHQRITNESLTNHQRFIEKNRLLFGIFAEFVKKKNHHVVLFVYICLYENR